MVGQKERIYMTKVKAKLRRKESSLVFVNLTQPEKAAPKATPKETPKETRMTMQFCRIWRLLHWMSDERLEYLFPLNYLLVFAVSKNTVEDPLPDNTEQTTKQIYHSPTQKLKDKLFHGKAALTYNHMFQNRLPALQEKVIRRRIISEC
jgi:hypothetical protein